MVVAAAHDERVEDTAMAKLNASDSDVADVEEFLRAQTGLEHLRARKRADLVTLISGPEDDPLPHARLRRLSASRWALEMPTHTSRWEPTPVVGSLQEVLAVLTDQFGWTLAALD